MPLTFLQNKQRRDRERRQQQQQANNMQVLSKTQKSRERLVHTVQSLYKSHPCSGSGLGLHNIGYCSEVAIMVRSNMK